ncbi:MAG TPA: GtrA family protein [Polyangiaceae bacterium]|nr:GtrA family protein [Polyangiaceae bacterium]
MSTLVRHQAASVAATVVDFGSMTALVEVARIAPHVATLAGAVVGACVNFALSRRHVFAGAGTLPPGPQAARYALVSTTSALLNALGEWVGTRALGGPYLVVRAIVAPLVSVSWNYPMHRGFVFRAAPGES